MQTLTISKISARDFITRLGSIAEFRERSINSLPSRSFAGFTSADPPALTSPQHWAVRLAVSQLVLQDVHALTDIPMPQRQAMRILIADDDPLLLDATAECIAIERPGWTVLVAKDGLEALRLLREVTVDILVADIEMPAMDGLSLLAEVRKDARLAALPMILATGRVDRASVRDGMASGADDYLTKPYTVDELVAAVEARLRRSQRGSSSEDPSFLRERVRQALTPRELEVLAMIGRGLVTKDIAKELDVSPATVSVHRANIMEKLDLHNAAALASLAARAGLS